MRAGRAVRTLMDGRIETSLGKNAAGSEQIRLVMYIP